VRAGLGSRWLWIFAIKQGFKFVNIFYTGPSFTFQSWQGRQNQLDYIAMRKNRKCTEGGVENERRAWRSDHYPVWGEVVLGEKEHREIKTNTTVKKTTGWKPVNIEEAYKYQDLVLDRLKEEVARAREGQGMEVGLGKLKEVLEVTGEDVEASTKQDRNKRLITKP
jgi:hypothetical protein